MLTFGGFWHCIAMLILASLEQWKASLYLLSCAIYRESVLGSVYAGNVYIDMKTRY